MKPEDCDLGRYITEGTANRLAEFVLEMLVTAGGTLAYSKFYGESEALTQELGVVTPWWTDYVIGQLEQAGVVETETLKPKRLQDGNFDYQITLVGEPRVPAMNFQEGRLWHPLYVPENGPPKGCETDD